MEPDLVHTSEGTEKALDIGARSVLALTALREKRPLVHNIANYVSMDVAANALLAIGASPAMVHASEEVAEFAALSDALVINIGTLSTPWLEAMRLAAKAANAKPIPWVLDPVGAGATRFRNRTIEALLEERPAVIRGNASEILAVAGAAGAKPKGVDSANTPEEAAAAADALAERLHCTVVASGAIDLITDGTRRIRLGNGHPMMAQVTALGCALSAIVGAFAAVERDPFVAAATATAVYGICGTLAAKKAEGPGSFRVAFIDALDRIDADGIKTHLKVL
jgi:hydroxyethylthiazole kinase